MVSSLLGENAAASSFVLLELQTQQMLCLVAKEIEQTLIQIRRRPSYRLYIPFAIAFDGGGTSRGPRTFFFSSKPRIITSKTNMGMNIKNPKHSYLM